MDIGYKMNSNHVKKPFVHAFRHFFRGTTFTEALRETIHGGGDTDTNACKLQTFLKFSSRYCGRTIRSCQRIFSASSKNG